MRLGLVKGSTVQTLGSTTGTQFFARGAVLVVQQCSEESMVMPVRLKRWQLVYVGQLELRYINVRRFVEADDSLMGFLDL